MNLEPVSQTELMDVEGGMIRQERVEAMPTPDYTNGMGYTGKMISYSLIVSQGGVIPC